MFGLSLSNLIMVAIVAIGIAFGAGYWRGDAGGASRVQAQWDRAKLAQKQEIADANDRAAQHDVALTAARTRQDRDADAALILFNEEVSREDACTTGSPLGPGGLERLQRLAGERR